jgi:hypothetical protein
MLRGRIVLELVRETVDGPRLGLLDEVARVSEGDDGRVQARAGHGLEGSRITRTSPMQALDLVARTQTQTRRGLSRGLTAGR